MDELAIIDTKSYLHSFELVSESQTPAYTITSAKGVMIYGHSGKAYLDAMSGTIVRERWIRRPPNYRHHTTSLEPSLLRTHY